MWHVKYLDGGQNIPMFNSILNAGIKHQRFFQGVTIGHMSLKLSKLLRVTIAHLQLTSMSDNMTSDALPDSPFNGGQWKLCVLALQGTNKLILS